MAARSFADVTTADLAAMRAPGSASYLLGKLHRVGRWVQNASSCRQPELGKALRGFVEAELDLKLPEIIAREASSDGATKLLMRLGDGKTIETVHMPRAVKNPRVTMCLSSQVGCAMGCTFCRTSEMGLVRNLTPAEIVGQVLATILALGPDDPGRISLVFMGMGEPLHNVAAVTRAIDVLCDEAGLGLAPMRITVSTSGLVPGIRALAKARKRPCLALSLNATTNVARSEIMPITKKHDLAALREALLEYPVRPHEKITLEYVLLEGKNDTRDDAGRIAEFARGYRSVVNVIPWNAYESGAFTRPTEESSARFSRWLREAGCLVTIRRSRGRDVGGACGQLATLSRSRSLAE
ncbi:23S rRNA (adenine(2503)-C(2))-methyltransferase RlmN [soil metagenome]